MLEDKICQYLHDTTDFVVRFHQPILSIACP